MPSAGTQLASWREQRAQLTQALHMWVGRADGARQRVAEAQARQAAENATPAGGGAGVPRRAGTAERGAQPAAARREPGAARAVEPGAPGARPADARAAARALGRGAAVAGAAGCGGAQGAGSAAAADSNDAVSAAEQGVDELQQEMRRPGKRARRGGRRPVGSLAGACGGRSAARPPWSRSRPRPRTTRRCATGSSATA